MKHGQRNRGEERNGHLLLNHPTSQEMPEILSLVGSLFGWDIDEMGLRDEAIIET